ncbi:MAG: hypothetical protein RIS11_1801, partial [Pseudomonadota bacterium]|jgi:hypothetical protein
LFDSAGDDATRIHVSDVALGAAHGLR